MPQNLVVIQILPVYSALPNEYHSFIDLLSSITFLIHSPLILFMSGVICQCMASNVHMHKPLHQKIIYSFIIFVFIPIYLFGFNWFLLNLMPSWEGPLFHKRWDRNPENKYIFLKNKELWCQNVRLEYLTNVHHVHHFASVASEEEEWNWSKLDSLSFHS